MSKFTSCNDCTERLAKSLRYCGRLCSHNPANINYFRPKAEKKIINLLVCVGSDIDMEFADSININDLGFRLIDTLKEDNTQQRGLYISKRELRGFEQCRVRQDHWHSYRGNDCPIPDGLIISYSTHANPSRRWVNRCSQYLKLDWSEIYEFKVIGVNVSWRYSWDKS